MDTRFKKAVKNSGAALIGQILTLILGFGVRTLFIRYLSKDYLGVNGIMESMMTLLNMTNLGLGTSIAFALYEPVNYGDERRVGTLMNFYKNAYKVIGVLVFVFGMALMPFMEFFARDAKDVPNVSVIYIIFVLDAALSYFFSYKRTLLGAYQENYINSLCDDGFAIVKYICQAVVLVAFKSYLGYLLVHSVFVFASNVTISTICEKKHPVKKEYKNEKLDERDKKTLKTSVISLMYHKIGGNLVNGTDNLMISYVGVAVMGVYSNYSMVVSIVERIVTTVLKALSGSMGSLMVQKDDNKKYKVYEEFVFTNFCLYFFLCTGMAGCLERFIRLWAGGSSWVLSSDITFIVILNMFLHGSRQPDLLIIDTAGLFNKMRAKAVAEVIVNLVVSLLFLAVLKMGIYGVLLGTTVSRVFVCIWWENYAVHKYSFCKSWKGYWKKYIKNTIVAATGCFLAYYLSSLVAIDGFFGLLACGVISVAVFLVLLMVFYSKSSELHSFVKRFKK